MDSAGIERMRHSLKLDAAFHAAQMAHTPRRRVELPSTNRSARSMYLSQ